MFYFGNVIGESGNDPTNTLVNLSDISSARTNQTGFGATDVLNVFDFNRDAVVNLADISIARTNQSGFTPISLITPTSSSGTPSNKLPPAAESIASANTSLPVADSTPELATTEASTLGLTAPLLSAITVSNATDVSNAPDTSSITALIANDGGDGISLREAITAANNTTGEDTITFEGSVFTGGNNSLIRLTQGELNITDSLSIDGTSVDGVVITGDANSDDVTVSGTNITDVGPSEDASSLDDNSRVLNISETTGNLTVTRLTITGGRTTDNGEKGGGIRFDSSSTLSLIDSTVSGNSTQGFNSDGGGIYSSSGDVSLASSTLSGNNTFGSNSSGGGITTDAGNVSLLNSTFSENRVNGYYSSGGGINTSSGSVTLSNSVVRGNSITDTSQGSNRGGGISTNSGSVTLTNSIVSENSNAGNGDVSSGSGGEGGGIATFGGSVSLTNSTVSRNTTAGRNGFGGGIFTSFGRVSLSNSAVSGNSTTGYQGSGGGIYSRSGSVSLLDSTVSGNSIANRGQGGGIRSRSGNVSLTDSTISENSVTGSFRGGDGGGISTSSGASVYLANSTVSGNRVAGPASFGGGISTYGSSVDDFLVLNNSTVSGNSVTGSDSEGGGIHNTRLSVSIVNSTITGNSSSGEGGGIRLLPSFSGTTLGILNSIVAGNNDGGAGPDVLTSADLIIENSLIGDTTGSGITAATGSENILNQPALLGPLADNGGPTQTHALLPGSPAIDAGSNDLAAGLTTDQRGNGFTRIDAGTVDVGSFELQPIQTAGQFVFYNNSSFDSASDSAAIATDKVALRNGETATFENYTSYIDGINGIAVDLFSSNGLVASDFQFSFGNDDDVDAYATLDSPSIITNLTTVAGAGVNGSDRVLIEFADGAITNGWLQVTVLANASTGLTDDDVFYFGNVIGESGNDPNNTLVNLSDISSARTNQTGFGATDVLNIFDFNRDAVVNLADISIARTNQSGFTPVNLITPTSSSGESSSKLPLVAESIASASVSLPVTVLTTELATPNFSSLAVATTVQTYTTDQLERSDSTEPLQQAPLALVGANLNTPSTQQNLLDQVFETSEQENDLPNKIPLTDIDSLFETNFSADF